MKSNEAAGLFFIGAVLLAGALVGFFVGWLVAR